MAIALPGAEISAFRSRELLPNFMKRCTRRPTEELVRTAGLKRVFLLAFAVVLVSPAANAQQPENATKVIKYVPTGPAGSTREGHCWTDSIAISRPDAWRCMAENEIFDPCFELPGGGSVLCNPNPAKGDPGLDLKLTKPLPKSKVPPESRSGMLPHRGGWLVELVDGTTCNPVTGASGLIDGKVLTYYCDGGTGNYVALLGDLSSEGSRLIAEKAEYSLEANGPKLLQSKRIPVKTVWQ